MQHDGHSHRHYGESMLSVEEALERILDAFEVLEPEEAYLLDALGQVLSEDVVATHNIPPLDNSAMDGYAVRCEDVVGAGQDTPVLLRVIGTVAAGHLPNVVVTEGTAVRIMTGAAIPSGANAVVPFEDTNEMEQRDSGDDINEIAIRYEVSVGADVRPFGQDIRKNEIVLRKGKVLRPYEIGVLASLGRKSVSVIRRPVVSILSTGDELLEPGDKQQGEGKIFDSNSSGIGAAVAKFGGIPKLLGIAKDDMDSVNEKLVDGLSADMFVTSAGVSKGDYDLVKDVLSDHGEIDFWSIRMRPAKPLAFGVLRSQDGRTVPHLGLPGNPVSAQVAFEQFGRAAISKMMGKTEFRKPVVNAILDDSIYNEDGRRMYARVVVSSKDGKYHAKLTGAQGSNLLTSMTLANGLAICPEGVAIKRSGDSIEVQMLDWSEDFFPPST